MRNNLKLSLVARNGDGISKDTSLSIYLDAVVEELLERSRVKYMVINRDGTVNGEFQHRLLLALSSLALNGLGCLLLLLCREKNVSPISFKYKILQSARVYISLVMWIHKQRKELCNSSVPHSRCP